MARLTTVLSCAAGVVLAACGSGSPTATPSSPPATTAPATTPSPTGLPADRSLVIGETEMRSGSGPSGVGVGPGGVWVTEHRGHALTRLDPRTGKVLARVEVDFDHSTEGSLEWGPVVTANRAVACVLGGRVLVGVDTTRNAIAWRRAVDCWSYAAAPDGVLVGVSGSVLLVDPVTGRTLRTTRTTGSVSEVAWSEGSIWVTYDDRRTVHRLAADGTVRATVRLPGDVWSLTGMPGGVALSLPLTDQVVRVDARTNEVARTAKVHGTDDGDPIITYADGALWLATANGGVVRMDARTLRVTWSAQLGSQDYVGHVGVGDGVVWYPTYGQDTVLRLREPGA